MPLPKLCLIGFFTRTLSDFNKIDMIKKIVIPLLMILLIYIDLLGQETFSIVAIDAVTNEVGAAGASCVDLFQFPPPGGDDFLAELFPGKGAIICQAFYLTSNQNNARNRMDLGNTPDQIIQWLIDNDVTSEPGLRQYGIVGLVNGLPESAAYTGASTPNYFSQIVGSTYTIQGNTLKGQVVLDSMEARFLKENGDLASKLMAALQGANMVGADYRCANNGTSSLFAFIKVSHPLDVFGSPSFLASVKTHGNAGIEPIDSLQTKFDLIRSGVPVGIANDAANVKSYAVFPNPSSDMLRITSNTLSVDISNLEIRTISGMVVYKSSFQDEISLSTSLLSKGIYLIRISTANQVFTARIIKN